MSKKPRKTDRLAPELQAEQRVAKRRHMAALTARRLLSVIRMLRTAKDELAEPDNVVYRSLIQLCRVGDFSGNLDKLGRQLVKWLNKDSESSGLRFAIAPDNSIRSGKVTVQFED